jgi:hypothetical protein
MTQGTQTSTAAEQGGGPGAAALEAFIGRWATSAGAERANYQLFLAELCDVLGVPRPDPSVADEAVNPRGPIRSREQRSKASCDISIRGRKPLRVEGRFAAGERRGSTAHGPG